MLEFGACPRCKQDVSAERRKKSPVICDHCGYTASPGRSMVMKAAEKQTIIIYSGLLVMFVAVLVQLVTWDRHSGEIIPLKLKQTIGMASPGDIDRIGEICMDLRKFDCVESNYSSAAGVDWNKLYQLGHFQMRRGKFNEAAHTYYNYFQKGGTELEASYDYAKALAKLGQVEEAIKYFDAVLAARPDVLQVTVVQNYVKLLMEHNRYDQARKLIGDIRGKGPQTGSFMEAEFIKIKEMTTASRE